MFNKIQRFIVADILKNRIVLAYTLLLAVLAWSVFSLEDDSHKGVLTLLNIVLLTTPLVSIIFTTIYLYNSAEFIELLAQPAYAQEQGYGQDLFFGLFFSLALAFHCRRRCSDITFRQRMQRLLILLVMGILITAVFVALGFLCAISPGIKQGALASLSCFGSFSVCYLMGWSSFCCFSFGLSDRKGNGRGVCAQSD